MYIIRTIIEPRKDKDPYIYFKSYNEEAFAFVEDRERAYHFVSREQALEMQEILPFNSEIIRED